MGAVTRILWVGDALDFWRVEVVEPGGLIRLRAEMKVPGRAWLEFQALPQPGGQTLLSQTAFFEPKGLLGLLYWYVFTDSQPDFQRPHPPNCAASFGNSVKKDIVGVTLVFAEATSPPRSLCATPQQKEQEQNRNRNSEKPK